MLMRLLIAVALLPGLTHALLKDRSALPDSDVIEWPQWYRDTNNLAMGLCKSQLDSPNAPGNPMCFPIVPNPAGFAGNIGDEIFYNLLSVTVVAGGLNLAYEAALEAAYANGDPIKDTEVVFTRIRIRADVTVPGTYVVIHPFGREVFTNVAAGRRAISLTRDIGIQNFDEALGGDVGPFIEWSNTAGTGRTNAGETLDIVNRATGKTERFVGDPNVVHAFKGSPTGFNKVRVEGPRGSMATAGTNDLNAAGQAIQFVEETRGSVMGQEWNIAIPTPFTLNSALYTRTPTLFAADVWATSGPGQELIVTGQGLPSVTMVEGAGGKYFAHIESATPPALPFTVTAYNLRSTPISTRSAPLVDLVDIQTATFDRATNTLTVTARSSDSSDTPAVLQLLEPSVASPAFTRDAAGLYTFTGVLAAGSPTPLSVRVRSDRSGVGIGAVAVSGVPQNSATAAQPVATDDSFIIATLTLTSMPIDVLANDVTSTTPVILILSQPRLLGTVSAPVTGGPVTLTRQVPSLTGRDSFTYALKVGTTVSRVATVTVITAIQGATAGAPPIANADSVSVPISATSSPINVLANDQQQFGGSPIDPTSVQAVNGAAGSAVVDPATGTITFTAPAIPGIYSFTYTVASTTGARSAPATVTVDVRQVTEVVTITAARFRKGRWNVDGTTSFFGALLTQTTATCAWFETSGTRWDIGAAPVDVTGAFAVVNTAANPTPSAATLARVECRTSNGGIGTTTVVRFN